MVNRSATLDVQENYKHSELSIDDLVSCFVGRNRDKSPELITRAYQVAHSAHEGQVRLTGDPYISHPLAVAKIVVDLGLDDISIAAALLHDTVEDTELTLSEIEAGFGPKLAQLVDSLTKLDRMSFDSKEAQQAATVRKLLIAMANDWRVLVVKLADRLHNIRTSEVLPDWKRKRLAQETLDIYAPLAHRLGIQEIKWQLEDLSFAILLPGPYGEISELVERRAPERNQYLQGIIHAAKNHLEELGITCEVGGRPKHHFSIYEKMVVKGKEFNEIFDLVGLRIIVESEKDCWATLGAIHGLWPPVHGRFKDYIHSPKFNLYQSLHTTVIGPGGKSVEVQIRTWEMHRTAEFGVAAHWGYKENSTPSEIAWLQRIVDWQSDTPDPKDFLESLRMDLEQDEVYVFTPNGKVITLAKGATPIDFAYAIHTDVGHHCIGAKVNDKLVSLDTELFSGQTVDIITSKSENAGPSQDWISIVRTARAKSKIRQWFSKERREDAIETGKGELAKALRRQGLAAKKLASSDAISQVAEEAGYSTLEQLHAAIGEGHLSPTSFAQKLSKELDGPQGEPEPSLLPRRQTRPATIRGAGIYVEGSKDMMVRLAKCCTPVPGDEIVGFITRGRGVSVHRQDCSNAQLLSLEKQERMVEVGWDHSKPGTFVTVIEVRSLDRSALLSDVTRVLAENHLNILASSSKAGPDRVSRMSFEVELADAEHLEAVIHALKRLDCVYEAYRVLPGSHQPKLR